MSARRKISLLCFCAIVVTAVAATSSGPRGLSSLLGWFALFTLGVAFALTVIGGRARLSERMGENVLIAGLLTFLLGIALAIALLTRSDLWPRFITFLGLGG